MATKTVHIPGIGEVMLAKRRGSRNLRLSVSPGGRVRVGLPAWVPYQTGVEFAISRRDWILRQLAIQPRILITNGHRVGKSHNLELVVDSRRERTVTRLDGTTVRLVSPWPVDDTRTQAAAAKACERALAKEASALLPQRVEILASRHGYQYKQVKIRKLTSRWGSCGSDGTITLSSYLIQLPWHLIDYVILHELAHTRHLNHSPEFWLQLSDALPSAKALRKEIRAFRPYLISH